MIAKSFARIHLQNLSNFGILPLIFEDPADWDKIDPGDVLAIVEVRSAIRCGNRIQLTNRSKDQTYETQHKLTQRQIEMVLAGSLINLVGRRVTMHRNSGVSP